jgi:hypothetical protein
MGREPDTEFGCAHARAALPTTDGVNRRACDRHRRSHRVRLVAVFLRVVSVSMLYF